MKAIPTLYFAPTDDSPLVFGNEKRPAASAGRFRLTVRTGRAGQIASLRSLATRKATFFDALILIASPVAGLRPMRAGRLRT